MSYADRSIIAVATKQLGAFTREQANRAGLSDKQLRVRLASGVFERVGPNALRLAGTGQSARARLYSLMLDVGGRTWATGPTAASLHRIEPFELTEPFHLVVERGRQVRRAGHEIHTSVYLVERDLDVVDGIPALRPTRVLMDLARMVDRTTLTIALDAALRDRLVNEDRLLHRIARVGDVGRAKLGLDALLAVIEGAEVVRGGHSHLEREFLRVVDAAGLPRPDCQQVLGRAGDRLVRVDFRFPGTSVVVEVMGYRYHRTKEQLTRDAERMNALLAQSLQPYQFTYEQVVETPDVVVATLRAALGRSPRAA